MLPTRDLRLCKKKKEKEKQEKGSRRRMSLMICEMHQKRVVSFIEKGFVTHRKGLCHSWKGFYRKCVTEAFLTCHCSTHCNTLQHTATHSVSCHTYEWVMSHIRMSHSLAHIRMGHTYDERNVTVMDESCHIYERVMSHIRTSHITHTNESCHTYEWVTNGSDMWREKCNMTHPYVRHDSFVCVTWIIHMCDMTHTYVWHDSFVCVTWLIRMCDMTHPYTRHDLFVCVTCLARTCDTIHSCVWCDSFVCGTWLNHIWTRLIHMWGDMTQSREGHD